MIYRLATAALNVAAFALGAMALSFYDTVGDPFAAGLCIAGLVVLLWASDSLATEA